MATLAARRCVQHPSREAVACCPHCRDFFCRECVVEHDGEVLCAACLAKLPGAPATRAGGFAGIGRLAVTAFAAFAVWLFFQLVGTTLVRIPPEYHEGTVWRAEAGNP